MVKLLKAVACVLLCVAMLVGCSNPLHINGYEIIGNVNLVSTFKYSFLDTLLALYPQSSVIAIATPISYENGVAQFRIDEYLAGSLPVGQLATVATSIPFDDYENQYLLFIKSDDKGYALLFDGAGPLRVNGDTIYEAAGGSASLEQAKLDILKLEENVFLPTTFSYYRELDELVLASDYIFSGTVSDIEYIANENFYVRGSDVELQIGAEAQRIRIMPEYIIKGSFVGEIDVLLSDVMLENCINAATLAPVTYDMTDAPPLEQGQTYIFFLRRSPSGLSGEYEFFVNPMQGYVPLYFDETLPIPTNAAFTFSYYWDELLFEIGSVLNSDASEHYIYEIYEPEDDQPLRN